MQKCGHEQVFVDVVSATATTQMVGRSHRIGQTHEVLVYRLNVDETYDQVQQALYQDRFRVTVATQSSIDNDHLTELARNLGEQQRIELEQEIGGYPSGQSLQLLLARPLRGPYADANMRQLFGLRSNRHTVWNRYYEPTAKNTLPEEIIFRLAYGGMVARECAEQVRKKEEGKADAEPKDTHQDTDDDDIHDPEVKPVMKSTPFAGGSVYTPDPRVSTLRRL